MDYLTPVNLKGSSRRRSIGGLSVSKVKPHYREITEDGMKYTKKKEESFAFLNELGHSRNVLETDRSPHSPSWKNPFSFLLSSIAK